MRKGDCAAKQKITSEEVEMNLQLPSGNFKVVAISGVSKGYVMSDNPKISDVITMQEGGCASKAMMMGMAVHADGEKTVVNFYEHSDSEKIATDLVEAYNASQDDVEVKLSIIANDDYDDKIKVMLSGGADIDCFWVRGGDQLRQMANGGAVLALDDMIDEAGVNFSDYGQMGEAYQTGGKTYGLCTSKSCWLLWYNKDLFDAAGEEYPLDLTWDEYADLCAKLNKDDLHGGLCVNWIMNTGSAAAGEYLTDENLTRTKRVCRVPEPNL